MNNVPNISPKIQTRTLNLNAIDSNLIYKLKNICKNGESNWRNIAIVNIKCLPGDVIPIM